MPNKTNQQRTTTWALDVGSAERPIPYTASRCRPRPDVNKSKGALKLGLGSQEPKVHWSCAHARAFVTTKLRVRQ